MYSGLHGQDSSSGQRTGRPVLLSNARSRATCPSVCSMLCACRIFVIKVRLLILGCPDLDDRAGCGWGAFEILRSWVCTAAGKGSDRPSDVMHLAAFRVSGQSKGPVRGSHGAAGRPPFVPLRGRLNRRYWCRGRKKSLIDSPSLGGAPRTRLFQRHREAADSQNFPCTLNSIDRFAVATRTQQTKMCGTNGSSSANGANGSNGSTRVSNGVRLRSLGSFGSLINLS